MKSETSKMHQSELDLRRPAAIDRHTALRREDNLAGLSALEINFSITQYFGFTNRQQQRSAFGAKNHVGEY